MQMKVFFLGSFVQANVGKQPGCIDKGGESEREDERRSADRSAGSVQI